MSIAIVSDIHANLEALQVVLESIRKKQADEIYCLGDIVGYGPNPNECVQLIREKCTRVLVGNHDYAAIGKADISYFNPNAKSAALWTRKKLKSEHMQYLSKLKFTHQNDEMLMVHASPTNPKHWYYVMSAEDASMEMQAFSQALCFIGHSHLPVIYTAERAIKTSHFRFEPEQKYVVNVGSVGQPRDGNPKACYALYEPTTKELEYVRLAYDVQTTYSKIIKEGLPTFLADRLLKGY